MNINIKDLKVGQSVKFFPNIYRGLVSDIGVITEININNMGEISYIMLDVIVDYVRNYNNTLNLCFYINEIIEIIRED